MDTRALARSAWGTRPGARPTPFARAVLARFALIFLPLLALLAGVAAIHYHTASKVARLTQESEESRHADLAQRTIAADLRIVASDLMFLAQLNELQELVKRPDMRQAMRLASEFLLFSESREIYDQIRYISADGTELVRVNYHNGNPRIVNQAELQRKADRYYFRETMKLERRQVYISPFDLNVEDGRIERPLKPVIRFATPLFDSQGRTVGILVLNYLGERLIRQFRQAAAGVADHLSLVNGEGYWLSHPQAENEWGFVLGHDHTFARAHPEAWRQMREQPAGQFYSDSGLFTFATLSPVEALAQRLGREPLHGADTWKIVAHLPPSRLAAAPSDFLRRHTLPYGAMLLLLLGGTWVLARTGVRHRLVKAQGEYERRFRATLESVKLAALALDAQGRVIFCNDFLLERTGWSREGVLGRDCVGTFIAEADAPAVRTMLAQARNSGRFPTAFENRMQTRSGESRLFAWSSTVSYDPLGHLAAITCIGEDITEQRRSEEQLRKLSQAVEQSPSPVIITNTEGIIEYVNPKFTQATGFSADEVIGKKPSMLKSGETPRAEYERLWQTIRSGGEWRGLFHNRKKNGELYWEYTAISPIRDAKGCITHFLAVKEDVTERKRLEQVEKAYVERVLESTGWHRGKACEILGVSRPRLRRMIKHFGLVPPPGALEEDLSADAETEDDTGGTP